MPDSNSDDPSVNHPSSSSARQQQNRRIQKSRRPPRFFVITDHPTRSILVCLRGTLSLDDIATDLACEPAPFDERVYWDDAEVASAGRGEVQSGVIPGKARAQVEGSRGYMVHGGMFEVAVAMGGSPSAPVTRAVAKALEKNTDYGKSVLFLSSCYDPTNNVSEPSNFYFILIGLFLVGHSLGAGIASLLGLMWANPSESLTSKKSGLPAGRSIKVYGFAPPCVPPASPISCRGWSTDVSDIRVGSQVHHFTCTLSPCSLADHLVRLLDRCCRALLSRSYS